MKWVFVLYCLLFFVPKLVVGQEGIQDPNEKYRIYDGGYHISSMKWANDSSRFVYQENNQQTGVRTSGVNNWHQYVVSTQQDIVSDFWPLQPSLTTNQQQALELLNISTPYVQTSFAFSSLNNRYIVYGAQNPRYAIGVADLQSPTGQHQILDEASELLAGGLGAFNDANNSAFEVFWSGDNSTFVTITSVPELSTRIHHVSDLGNLINPPIIRNLTDEGMVISGSAFYALELFDISSDANLLLVKDQTNRFAIWNVSTASGTLITTQGEVTGATFLTDQRIMFVDQAGLKHFHIPSSHIAVLNPNITSTLAPGGAYFSPDGHYVAVYNGGVGGPARLYLFEITGTNLALFNTTTYLANLLQTLDTEPAAIDYYTYATGVPTGATGGQWVMGDWNGDGVETPGVYGPNGVFYHTNALGPSSNWQGTWFGLLTGTAGNRPVAGRFDASVNHDCIGVTDSSDFPPYGTAFALYFTCDLAGGNPPKTFQWLSVLLPDSTSPDIVGKTWEFSAGNFDPTVDAIDTIACRRGNFITWTNTPPSTPNAAFPYAQYIGAPHSGTSLFVVGDWNSDGTDSFGLYYAALGRLRGRDDLDWNSGLYPVDQQLDTNIVGTTSISATTWRLR